MEKLSEQLSSLRAVLYTLLVLLLVVVGSLSYNLVTGQGIFAGADADNLASQVPDSSQFQNVAAGPDLVHNQAGQELFKSNCTACHALQEVVVGPALAGVTQRRPKAWLYAFVQNSTQLIERNDPVAVKLYEQYGRTQMPSFQTLTTAEMDSIFDYLGAQPLR